MKRVDALLLGTLLLGVCAQARDAPGQGERRILAVNVVDEEGNEIPGLTVDNFRGAVRGEKVEILSVAPDTSPRRIAVLVDTSGSIRERPKTLAFAWRAAEDVVGSLGADHALALFTFGERLRPYSSFTNDPQALQAALMRARAEKGDGPTALYNAVVQTCRAFSGPGFGDVIYLVSDGEDTASRLREKDTETAASGNGIRIFVVRVPPATRAVRQAQTWADNWVRSITEATGGGDAGAEASDLPKVAKRLRAFSSLIRRVYRLEVAFPHVLATQGKWTLEVTDGNGRRLKGDQVIYPHLLVPSSGK